MLWSNHMPTFKLKKYQLVTKYPDLYFQTQVKMAKLIEAKDDGSGCDNWTTGAISRAKLQSNHHHQQTNT